MADYVEIFKDENEELPIPTAWRNAICDVVEAFKLGDFKIERGVSGVVSPSDQDANSFRKSVESYGEKLVSLPNETWNTSIYRWMGDYWQLLVDLFTEGGQSDLVLFLNVTELGADYRFEIESLHVP